MRWIIIPLFFSFVCCKKINYEAVEVLDLAILELPEEEMVNHLKKLSINERLPEDVRSHLKLHIAEGIKKNCFERENKSSVQRYLKDIRAYLLYREWYLPDYLICNLSENQIKIHQLNPGETYKLTIEGIDLNYARVSPSYVNTTGTYIDIPSIYCDPYKSGLDIRIGGNNGLPMDETVESIMLGKHNELEIRVIHTPISPFGLQYQVHIEQKGWLPKVNEGEWAGTRGQGLRMESLTINLEDTSLCNLMYRIKAVGTTSTPWNNLGTNAGDIGQARAIETIWLRLVDCPGYSIEYQGHIENIGDTDWVANGYALGDENSGRRIEAIRIRIIQD